MTLTYVDAGVLIVAARGEEARSERALAILDDPGRTFAARAFLKLEVIPQAAFHKQADELAFYDRFFEGVSVWAGEDGLAEAALHEASSHGLHAMDPSTLWPQRRPARRNSSLSRSPDAPSTALEP